MIEVVLTKETCSGTKYVYMKDSYLGVVLVLVSPDGETAECTRCQDDLCEHAILAVSQ